jgi:alpha-galactosidase
MKLTRMLVSGLLVLLLSSGAAVAFAAQGETHNITGRNIRIEIDSSLHSRVVALLGGKEIVIGPFAASESIHAGGSEVADFKFTSQKRESVQDKLGAGQRYLITGTAPSLRKTLAVTVYNDFPRMAFFDVQYTNTGKADLAVAGWTNNWYSISAGPGGGEPAFWSYQSGSYENRPDWVLPLKPGFKQENFMGMNAPDYGGGTPVSDVWRRDAGIAVGHVEMVPKLVSVPVAMPDAGLATLGVAFKTTQALKPGATLKTFRTFVAVHQGDHFQTLTEYRRVMMKQGVVFHPAPESAFQPIWCAWGFGKNATPTQIVNALPVVKKLGFTWVTPDWGWESLDGDGTLLQKTYPNGDADMRALVNKIHAEGFKAQLWWGPLITHPQSETLKNHPERMLLNADGSKQRISFWNGWYQCPADPAVIEWHRQMVIKIVKEWGFDGLKLDGMHMNMAPPCYNPAHKHAHPEDSVEKMPDFFKMIFDTARSIKPDVMIEWCPCGDAYSFYMLPNLNMSVASDPRNSFQVRSKGKTLKALHGDEIAYFGDHVRMTPDGESFASTIGIGGVPGTNFTWPVGASPATKKGPPQGELTPAREEQFAKWLKVYKDKMLSRGEYLGALYDMGFDKPETHALRKAKNMYYSFYAPDFSGKVELRGLESRAYRVTDYVNGKDLGTVRGPVAPLDIQFKAFLMLEAKPE